MHFRKHDKRKVFPQCAFDNGHQSWIAIRSIFCKHHKHICNFLNAIFDASWAKWPFQSFDCSLGGHKEKAWQVLQARVRWQQQSGWQVRSAISLPTHGLWFWLAKLQFWQPLHSLKQQAGHKQGLDPESLWWACCHFVGRIGVEVW